MIPRRDRQARAESAGFTLVELLVVILIVVLLSVAALPIIAPALNQRRVGDAARIIHAELNRIRDEAIRANAPRGFRLLPDAPFDPGQPNAVLTASRMIAIEQPPDYSEGLIFRPTGPATNPAVNTWFTNANIPFGYHQFMFVEKKTSPVLGVNVPNPPTAWFWNVRQGDRLMIAGSNTVYTIIGPMRVSNPALNPERFINWGFPDAYRTGPASDLPEFLLVVDGKDNDGDGFTDEMFDGINNDGAFYPAGHDLEFQPVIDPGFNGIDDDGIDGIDNFAEIFYPYGDPSLAEFEIEDLPTPSDTEGYQYRIMRRPVPSIDAREVRLPAGVAIDLTTWNAPSPFRPERSRLPVDPRTGFVDVLVAPGGQVLQSAARANSAPQADTAYYHFWLTDVEDVHDPKPITPELIENTGGPCFLRTRLPMPRATESSIGPGCGSYPPPGETRVLRGERRLVSLNTRSGQIVTTTLENFDISNINRPYQDALAGFEDNP